MQISNPSYAKRISKIRSRTVEPELGTLIYFTNMRRINSKGMAQANKHALEAALTYNLKKYLRFNRRKVKTAISRKGCATATNVSHWLFLFSW